MCVCSVFIYIYVCVCVHMYVAGVCCAFECHGDVLCVHMRVYISVKACCMRYA